MTNRAAPQSAGGGWVTRPQTTQEKYERLQSDCWIMGDGIAIIAFLGFFGHLKDFIVIGEREMKEL